MPISLKALLGTQSIYRRMNFPPETIPENGYRATTPIIQSRKVLLGS